MNIKTISNFIKIKTRQHLKHNILYLRATIHIARYFIFKNYRKKRCLVDPPMSFFYKYGKLANYFSIPLKAFAKYLKKKNIFISINNDCNSSIGHIYAEIGLIHRMQKLDNRYIGSKVWFLSSRKDILVETKDIFENKNFRIFFGGIKRILLIFVATNNPSISIDGSIGHANYIKRINNTDFHVFDQLPRQRAKLIKKDQNFYPNKDKLINYEKAKCELLKKLNIKKKYIIIQTKPYRANGTLEPLRPDLFLKTIDYFQNKDYQVVFAGREKLPKIFFKKSIIDYANSEFASAINDYILVGNCTLVLASASGFCFLPESLDKPLLIINAHHISQHSGRRTIYLPTLLSRRSIPFTASMQHHYLCTYGKRCGYFTFDDLYILHAPTSEEIYMAAKELEEMLKDKIPAYTALQKSISKDSKCPLIGDGLSRISNYFLKKHKNFFI